MYLSFVNSTPSLVNCSTCLSSECSFCVGKGANPVDTEREVQDGTLLRKLHEKLCFSDQIIKSKAAQKFILLLSSFDCH